MPRRNWARARQTRDTSGLCGFSARSHRAVWVLCSICRAVEMPCLDCNTHKRGVHTACQGRTQLARGAHSLSGAHTACQGRTQLARGAHSLSGAPPAAGSATPPLSKCCQTATPHLSASEADEHTREGCAQLFKGLPRSGQSHSAAECEQGRRDTQGRGCAQLVRGVLCSGQGHSAAECEQRCDGCEHRSCLLSLRSKSELSARPLMGGRLAFSAGWLPQAGLQTTPLNRVAGLREQLHFQRPLLRCRSDVAALGFCSPAFRTGSVACALGGICCEFRAPTFQNMCPARAAHAQASSSAVHHPVKTIEP